MPIGSCSLQIFQRFGALNWFEQIYTNAPFNLIIIINIIIIIFQLWLPSAFQRGDPFGAGRIPPYGSHENAVCVSNISVLESDQISRVTCAFVNHRESILTVDWVYDVILPIAAMSALLVSVSVHLYSAAFTGYSDKHACGADFL